MRTVVSFMQVNNINMIKELNIAFKDIVYQDSAHTYFHKNQSLQSVTQFLSSLKQPFDKNYWAVYKAYEFSGHPVKMIWNSRTSFKVDDKIVYLSDDYTHLKVQPEQILEQWDIEALTGTTRGSYVHDYLENLEKRLIDPIPLPNIDLSTVETIKFYTSLRKAESLCKDWYHTTKEYLIPIAMEFIVGDATLELAGRFDRLYFNLNTQEYEIWDFKTDKKLNYENKYSKLKLFNLPDCEYEKYSLQVSLYKKIIEDNLGVKLGQSRIVHFNIKEETWSIIEAKDYTQLLTDKL